ncbi:MAG: replication initiation factor domain-containing protein [Oscillospiraceae bacterium]|nr:replication initiation factor domain-containing protein [Oscillospiraceae bacterium]
MTFPEYPNSFYLFDWVSFTSKIHSPADLIEDVLKVQGVPFTGTKGANGYRDRLYFGGISIHYNGREDMGVWCELSGQGCRTFESYSDISFYELFKSLSYDGGDINYTRTDIAFDDHDGILEMDELFHDTQAERFVSKFDYYEAIISSKGSTINHGCKGSNTMIRIYDKARERGLTDGTHWIRAELQLRKENAAAFVRRYVNFGEDSIRDKFLGIIKNNLRYVVPSGSDSNKWRWEMTEYWSRFVGAAERVRLFENLGVEYNLGKLEDYIFKQAGNAIATYIEIKGMDSFIEELTAASSSKINPKYRQLKAEHGSYYAGKDKISPFEQKYREVVDKLTAAGPRKL